MIKSVPLSNVTAGPEPASHSCLDPPGRALCAPGNGLEHEHRLTTLDVGVLEGILDFERRLGKSVLPGMVEILERHVPPSCVRIRTALGEGDAVTVRRISHKLKSSARCLGLPRLGEVCAELELSAADGCLSGSEARVAAIEQEYEQAASALRRFVGG